MFPSTFHDSLALYELPFGLPVGSEVYTDSAYTNYVVEDELYENYRIKLSPQRKSNSRRWQRDLMEWYKSYMRKRIETVPDLIGDC